MSANKNIFSRILLIMPLFFLAMLNVSTMPVYAMDSKSTSYSIIKDLDPESCGLLNGFTRNGFEVFSKEMQHKLYGAQNNQEVKSTIKNLINEVIKEIKGFPQEVEIKKMSPQAVCPIAQEYRFIGVAPTNKTLYVDENYFNTNILNQTKDAQKLIIRTALEHYLNGTYTKIRTSRFLTSSLAGMVAGKVGQYSVNALSSAVSNYLNPSNANLNATSNSTFDIVKNLGIFAAKATIGTIIATKAYNTMYNILDVPTQKYIEYKENEFDKEAVSHKSIEEKINLAKQWTQLQHNGREQQHNFIMQDRIRKALPEVHKKFVENTNKLKKEFDQKRDKKDQVNQLINNYIAKQKTNDFYAQELKDYIVDWIMNDWKNQFYQAKKNNKANEILNNFILKSPVTEYPAIADQLQPLIEKFQEKEILPFYNG